MTHPLPLLDSMGGHRMPLEKPLPSKPSDELDTEGRALRQRGDLRKLSDALSEDAVRRVEEGVMDDLEGIGRVCASILLSAFTDGQQIPKAEFDFLKQFALSKTPPPVQRIEQRTILDLGKLIEAGIGRNEGIRERMIRDASEVRSEIVEAHNLGEDLSLPLPKDEEDYREVGEPGELRKLRGDK